ncbi:unnamed protein product [Adineta steineri]|uniref:EF-hand domain-containing protein n=1 Tax=Adineta steineri TaxID=433720 RepID=A0A819GZU5_9BILA|nr:unnamed protein product [Adineta steineri]
MGNRSSQTPSNPWNAIHLAEATGLSTDEINQFYSEFVKASGYNGVMNMSKFIQLYSHLPAMKSQDANEVQERATRIFRAFDRKNTGILSFDEFIAAIIMINYEMAPNIPTNSSIQENNTSEHELDDGRITAEDGQNLFRRLNDYYGLPAGGEQKCWKEVDRDNRGYVTKEELIEYISHYQDGNRQ